MNQPPDTPIASCCDGDPDFSMFASSDPPTYARVYPNTADIGVVTLGPPDASGAREFVSRRPLSTIELSQLWDEHFARHAVMA